MLAWSFAARTPDEIARLLRSLGKHRYVREVDHRLHWSVDHALAELEVMLDPPETPAGEIGDFGGRLARRRFLNAERLTLGRQSFSPFEEPQRR